MPELLLVYFPINFLFKNQSEKDARTMSVPPPEQEPTETKTNRFLLKAAIRAGRVKLPVLDQRSVIRALADQRTTATQRGVLRDDQIVLLQAGLKRLRKLQRDFRALDPPRRPRMLVVCDSARVARLVAAFLQQERGLARGDTTIIDSSAKARTGESGAICVIVALRESGSRLSAKDVLKYGLGLLWPESDYRDIKRENRARIAAGLAPSCFFDVLAIVEHPDFHGLYDEFINDGIAGTYGDRIEDMNSAGDLIVAGLRLHFQPFDFVLPSADGQGKRLSETPRVIVRESASMRVTKSIYTHQGWPRHSGEQHRMFVQSAEIDERIEAFCGIGDHSQAFVRLRYLKDNGQPEFFSPDYIVRTMDAIHLVELPPPENMPHRIVQRRRNAALDWCNEINGLPLACRSWRDWRWAAGHSLTSAVKVNR